MTARSRDLEVSATLTAIAVAALTLLVAWPT
ncbi:membrane protein [Gordonia phage Finkle]|uniref:Membrane protein n=1 Tax=Gordonia phage Finkle TaxID=2926099 RepID=A0A9E7NJZ4_9CAUD|nr:membrane protein [Gordonia phage Finkle]UTN92974.1 membrane protein [Gordonia phage Finkle]